MMRNGIRTMIAVTCAAATAVLTGCGSTYVHFKPKFDWNDASPTSEATKLRKELKKTIAVRFKCEKSNAFVRGTKKAALYGDEWGEVFINGGLVGKLHRYHAPKDVTIPVKDGKNQIQVQYMRRKLGKTCSPRAMEASFWVHSDFNEPHILVQVERTAITDWMASVDLFTGYKVVVGERFRIGQPIAMIWFQSLISKANSDFARKPLTPPYQHTSRKRYKYEE